MKIFEFRPKFHWSLFLRAQLTIFQHWFALQATSHYLNQWWLIYRRIYAPLGLNDLIHVNKRSPSYIRSHVMNIVLQHHYKSGTKTERSWTICFLFLYSRWRRGKPGCVPRVWYEPNHLYNIKGQRPTNWTGNVHLNYVYYVQQKY